MRLQETKAGDLLERYRIGRDVEARRIVIFGRHDQKVSVDRIGARLVLGVVLEEAPVVGLAVGNEEGLALASRKGGEAEIGRARDHAKALVPGQEVELGVGGYLAQQAKTQAPILDPLEQPRPRRERAGRTKRSMNAFWSASASVKR